MPNKLISLHFKFYYFQSKTTKTSIFQSCNIHTHRPKYNSKAKTNVLVVKHTFEI